MLDESAYESAEIRSLAGDDCRRLQRPHRERTKARGRMDSAGGESDRVRQDEGDTDVVRESSRQQKQSSAPGSGQGNE